MCWVMPPASPARDLGLADRVEQRRLAVVDVAHDRDDRRALDQRLLGSSKVSSSSSTSSAALTIGTFLSNASARTSMASSESVWVSVAISPSSISFLMTSGAVRPRTPRRP